MIQCVKAAPAWSEEMKPVWIHSGQSCRSVPPTLCWFHFINTGVLLYKLLNSVIDLNFIYVNKKDNQVCSLESTRRQKQLLVSYIYICYVLLVSKHHLSSYFHSFVIMQPQFSMSTSSNLKMVVEGH